MPFTVEIGIQTSISKRYNYDNEYWATAMKLSNGERHRATAQHRAHHSEHTHRRSVSISFFLQSEAHRYARLRVNWTNHHTEPLRYQPNRRRVSTNNRHQTIHRIVSNANNSTAVFLFYLRFNQDWFASNCEGFRYFRKIDCTCYATNIRVRDSQSIEESVNIAIVHLSQLKT